MAIWLYTSHFNYHSAIHTQKYFFNFEMSGQIAIFNKDTGRSLTVCWSLLPGGGLLRGGYCSGVCSRGVWSWGVLLRGGLVQGGVWSWGDWSEPPNGRPPFDHTQVIQPFTLKLKRKRNLRHSKHKGRCSIIKKSIPIVQINSIIAFVTRTVISIWLLSNISWKHNLKS